MDPRQRAFLLDEIDTWRREGLIGDELRRSLRERYAAAPDTSVPPEAPSQAPTAADANVPRGEAGGFAVGALQLLGGLLLGAALVALVVLLDLPENAASTALLALGAAGLGLGALLQHTMPPERAGLAQAAYAAGLVGVLTSAFPPEDDIRRTIGLVGALLAAATVLLLRGRGPNVVVASLTFAVTSFVAADVEFFDDTRLSSIGWWLSALGWTAFLLVWRRERWVGFALALQTIPLAVAFLALLDAWNLNEDLVTEGLFALHFGLVLAIGLWLGVRGLVAGAAAALTIDAIVFAFDLGGPGTALVVLLALGGLLLWQAEWLRGYFGRRHAR